MSLQDGMLTSMQAMANAKGIFDQKVGEYRKACEKNDWQAVDRLRLEVVSAMESTLDSMATGYRLISETISRGV